MRKPARVPWHRYVLPIIVAALQPTMVSCGGSVASSDDGGKGADATWTSTALEAGGPRTDGGTYADTGTDGARLVESCQIQSAAYDPSCSTDSDCVGTAGSFPVQFGDYCRPLCICGGDAINRDAASRYAADVARTPAGSGQIALLNCGCSAGFEPCSRNHTCVISDRACSSAATDSGPFDIVDANSVIDGTVLYSLNAGPTDGATLDVGPTRLCAPPESCVTYNKGWACCGPVGVGVLCFSPGDDAAP